LFSTGHLIWIGISLLLTAGGIILLFRFRPPDKKVLTFCLLIGIVSEVIKVISVAEIVPMVDPVVVQQSGGAALDWIPTGEYTPYIALEHMPLELCSLYLLFMALAVFLKDGGWKHGLYSVMFASGVIGGLLGVVGASIAGDFKTTAEFLSAPRAWQFFLFHSMIVTVSVYLGFGNEINLTYKDLKKAIIGLVLLDVPTFYLNSVFSSEVYKHDQVVGVTHRINFFSSYVNPLGLVLTEKWQWIAYLCLRALLFAAAVWIMFLLLKIKKKDAKENG